MKDEVMAGPQGATEKLRQILAKCPPDLMAADAAIEILGDDLTESYGKSHSVLVPLKDVIAFSKELQRDNESKVLVYTDESLEVPYMAHLICDSAGNWKLNSFLGQCLVCFGNGVATCEEYPYEEPCPACGAKGYGTVNF